jgi:hypothetical protein
VKHGKITVPSISVIFNDYLNHLNNLFDTSYDGLRPGGDLWPLTLHCLATFVMYLHLPSLELLVGHNNLIINKIHTIAQSMDITNEMLRVWGEKIEKKWKNDIIINQVSTKGNSADSRVIQEVLKLQSQVQLLTKCNEVLEQKLGSMHDLLHGIYSKLSDKEISPGMRL